LKPKNELIDLRDRLKQLTNFAFLTIDTQQRVTDALKGARRFVWVFYTTKCSSDAAPPSGESRFVTVAHEELSVVGKVDIGTLSDAFLE